MAKIETLKNKSGEEFYPLTHTKAVVDENGNTIEARLVVADNEDIVADGNVLKFKDRDATDGMGYVVLRKDKSFKEQVTKPNTIYEIRYDFNLADEEHYTTTLDKKQSASVKEYVVSHSTVALKKGEVLESRSCLILSEQLELLPNPYIAPEDTNAYIGQVSLESNVGDEVDYTILHPYEGTIPENCVLKFQGGSLRNGTIIGDNTCVESCPIHIFGTDVTLSGTWDVGEAYAEWFGAKGDGATDDRLAIQKSLDSFYRTKLLRKLYLLNSYSKDNTCLILPEKHILTGDKREEGETGAFIYANIKMGSELLSTSGDNVVLSVGKFCTVENISIQGNAKVIEHDHTRRCVGITHESNNAYRITLRNLDIKACYYAVNMSCWMSRFEQVVCRYNLYGIVLHGIISGKNNGVWDIYTQPSPTYSSVITSLFITNCYCNGCFLGGFYLTKITYSSMLSCAADGCGWFNRNSPWGEFPEDIKEVTNSNTFAAYRFSQCSAFNVAGLGGEEDVKFIQTDRCVNMSITNCSYYCFYAYTQYEQKDNYLKFDRLLTSIGDKGVEYKNIQLSFKHENYGDTLLHASGISTAETWVKFINIYLHGYGYLGSESLISKGHSTGSVVSIESQSDHNDIYTKSHMLANSKSAYGEISSGNLRQYLNKYYNPGGDLSMFGRRIICEVDGNIAYDGSIKGNNDILYIQPSKNGNDEFMGIFELAVNGQSSFANFKSIHFTNMKIVHGSGNIEYLIKFSDCGTVTFENCQFIRKSAINVNKFFEANGAALNFIGCSNPDTHGTTRPNLSQSNKGYTYYDESINKLIVWTGTTWVDATGAEV